MDTSYYNRFGGEELMRRLASETLLAQGPMGSVLLSECGSAGILEPRRTADGFPYPSTVRRRWRAGAHHKHVSGVGPRARSR